MGFTPYLLTGVYIGFDQAQSMGKGEAGGTTALPAFVEYRLAVEPMYPTEDFPQPPGIVWASVDGVSMPFKEGQDKSAYAGIIGGESNHQLLGPQRAAGHGRAVAQADVLTGAAFDPGRAVAHAGTNRGRPGPGRTVCPSRY